MANTAGRNASIPAANGSRAPTPNQATKEPIELAVAVLDEAVYDLIQGGQDYFDPYKGFTRLDPLDLSNYSLLTRLVGRQKFEKKGATPRRRRRRRSGPTWRAPPRGSG